jgi:diacylglycerol kinase family enzyme
LRCAGPLVASGKLPSAAVRRFQAKEFTLSSPSDASFEVEGELAGMLPVKIGVVPRGLRVKVP